MRLAVLASKSYILKRWFFDLTKMQKPYGDESLDEGFSDKSSRTLEVTDVDGHGRVYMKAALTPAYYIAAAALMHNCRLERTMSMNERATSVTAGHSRHHP
ncbi:hypothetical protein PCASD_09665 [Puccinia coronata f. sp. avenae]|uniref:Uncharacterized protein n=1 Tax=Puccinia coronata f. sp. avenae TaxID=200324 RepID=A0A2N5UHU8_9BASI|nr:hypothetical protein PCASD_09665 [Puccinia coronata f. sp. avenae]